MKIVCLIENTGQPGLFTEHGLSLYIEVNGRRILFDAGQSAAFADNAALLGISLEDVDMAILSHGHYDHSGGLLRFMEINRHAPVYVNRNAFESFYSGSDKYIGLDPALKNHPRFVLTDDALDLGCGMSLCTMNGAERPYPSFGQGLTVEVNGKRIPDSFLHEQYLTICENGRKIVFSGCSHKGVMNIIQWLNPDILLGGFHFMKLDPEQDSDRCTLKGAAECLLRSSTEFYTCHCTGEAPYAFIKPVMGNRLHYLSGGDILNL